MSVVVFGINHHHTPITIREQLSFVGDELGDALQSLGAWQGVDEAIIISTCNRMEIYCHVSREDAIVEWLSYYKQVSTDLIVKHRYIYEDYEAVKHLMRVASGLDSMVVGEPQILGQVKSGFSEACLQGTVGQVLSNLFRQTFSIAKKIRTSTDIGACPVSVASTVCAFACKKYAELMTSSVGFHEANVLVIGAGTTSKLVLQHIAEQAPKSMTVLSRHLDHAKEVVDALHVEVGAGSLDELSKRLPSCDIVISATASMTPILTRHMQACFLPEKDYLLIDIAVPRDIDDQLGACENIHLFNIDDLKQVISANINVREHAASQAEYMITEMAKDFMLSLRSLEVAPIIKRFRAHIESLCQSELDKALRALQLGAPAEQVLSQLTQSVSKKLLHVPCMQMKQAGYEGRADILHLVHELFGMHEEQVH